MKIVLKFLILFLTIPTTVFAKTSYYLPLDQIRFPELDSRWDAQIASGPALIRFDLREDARKPGQFRSQVVFSKRLLRNFEQKNSIWKQAEKKYLPSDAKMAGNSFDTTSGLGEWRYTTSVNLMPVLGSRLSLQRGSYVYSLDCQSEEQGQPNFYEWCAGVFKKIQWSDALPIAPDKSKLTLNAFIKTTNFDSQSIANEIQDLTLDFSPDFTDYKRYAYLLVLQALVGDGGSAASTKHIEDLAAILRQDPKPTEPLADWLLDTQAAANGTFTEKAAEKALARTNRPPFWLVGAWLRRTSPALALNLMERDPSEFALKHAMMGALYAAAGQFEKAQISYAKAEPSRHPDLAVGLAQTFWQQNDAKNAKKWLEVALKANPDDAAAKFLQANILEQSEQGEQAARLYAELAEHPALPPSIAPAVYAKCAQSSPDPDMRIGFYNKILAIQNNSPDALYALGRLYLLEKNDSQRSLSYFEKFVQVAPATDPKVSELRAMIEQIRTVTATDAENPNP